MMISDIHTPVMLEETLDLLVPALEAADRPVSLDGTLGMGGHAEALLERVPALRLVGVDRDAQALDLARERLARFGDRVTLHHAANDLVAELLAEDGVDGLDGAMLDLGVSSLQLDTAERGFSYRFDAPLDMRMDRTSDLTAERVVNEYDREELARIFRQYGEEPLAWPIAKAIARRREQTPIRTTLELVELIDACVPAAQSRRRGHNAKRVFQAIRVEVNDELGVLERALDGLIDALVPGGRLVVLSFQSLEDRIVKRVFAKSATSSQPAGLPVDLPGHGPRARLLVRGAQKAGAAEQERNPRAIPVRLRALEKLPDPSTDPTHAPTREAR